MADGAAQIPTTGEHRAVQSGFWRHDLLVVIVGVVLLAGGLVAQWVGSVPSLRGYDKEGVSFQYPASWLATPGGELVGEDSITRIVVRTSPKPAASLGNVDALLELERGRAYGRLYQRSSSARTQLGGKEWLRTEYTYAFLPSEGAAPRVASAVELAYPADLSVNTERLTVVTMHGSPERLKTLEPQVARSLTITP